MAALYLDRGLEVVRQFMEPIWKPLIQADVKIPQDPKSELQEWTQKRYKKLPVYRFLERSGSDHQPVFKVSVTVGEHTTVGIGNSKKQAEQSAAEVFLKEYKNGHK
jgi:ribonuclease-3